MNLLIFLDLTYNPGRNFKFYSLQGQNFKIFLIFTYNQGKVFLILPITQGAHVYLVSTGSCFPPPPLPLLLIILAAAKISETISRVQFSSYNRKQVIFIGRMCEKHLHGLLYCAGYLVQRTVCTSYIGLQCLLFTILQVQYFTE